MSDVFLSYARADSEVAERLVARLEAAGLSVYIDRKSDVVARWKTEIYPQLVAARVVVVLWSVKSIHSDIVQEEARYARDKAIMVPVRVDRVALPREFDQSLTLDLIGPNADDVVAAVRQVLSRLAEVETVSASIAGRVDSMPPTLTPAGKPTGRERSARIADKRFTLLIHRNRSREGTPIVRAFQNRGWVLTTSPDFVDPSPTAEWPGITVIIWDQSFLPESRYWGPRAAAAMRSGTLIQLSLDPGVQPEGFGEAETPVLPGSAERWGERESALLQGVVEKAEALRRQWLGNRTWPEPDERPSARQDATGLPDDSATATAATDGSKTFTRLSAAAMQLRGLNLDHLQGLRRSRWAWGFAAGLAVVTAYWKSDVLPNLPGLLEETFHAPAADQYNLQPGTLAPEMVVIPAGRFTMGTPESEARIEKFNGDQNGFFISSASAGIAIPRFITEGPQHEVVIARPFALGRYEVTFEEYEVFAKEVGEQIPDDEGWGRGRRPLINVSWDDAQAYVDWLAKKTHQPYRLPTEAEWEYAARAGTTTARYWGDDPKQACRYANVDDQSHGCKDGYASQTAPVGSFVANAFGLQDMLGNVWEWVADCSHDDYNGAPSDGAAWQAKTGECDARVLRGGSWYSKPNNVRSANRDGDDPGARGDFIGFRLARTLK